jgi:hypothetical protein
MRSRTDCASRSEGIAIRGDYRTRAFAGAFLRETYMVAFDFLDGFPAVARYHMLTSRSGKFADHRRVESDSSRCARTTGLAARSASRASRGLMRRMPSSEVGRLPPSSRRPCPGVAKGEESHAGGVISINPRHATAVAVQPGVAMALLRSIAKCEEALPTRTYFQART